MTLVLEVARRWPALRCAYAMALLACSAAMAAAPVPRPGELAPPGPKYRWRAEQSAMIPMRDGVSLATDLYFPIDAKGPLPVIFVKPGGYGKHIYRPDIADRRIRHGTSDVDAKRESGGRGYFHRFGYDHNVVTWFASQGYVVAVQDARGRFESSGRYTLVKDHSHDIYDSVDWLSRQSWSNGRIGMFGCSYGGEVQLYQAARPHPALRTIVPQAAGTAAGSAGGFYSLAHLASSGVTPLGILAPWYQGSLLGPYQQKPRPPGLSDEQWRALLPLHGVMASPTVDWPAAFRASSEIEMMAGAGLEPGGVRLTDWRDFVSHFEDVRAPWWQQFDFVNEGDPISVPALYTDAWYDLDPRLLLYLRAMYERTGTTRLARENQFLIIAPTTHCRWDSASEEYALGPLKVGDARFGHLSIYLSWFDHWLKGIENGIEQMPKIQYFVIGRGEWRATNTWPPPQTRFTPLHLTSDGSANSHLGNGTLTWAAPGSEKAGFDTYLYDPADPVPTAGAIECECSEVVVDQRSVSARDDVLVYTTAPLEEGLEITGPVEIVLHVSITTPDTDLFAKLVEVYPDGRALNIYQSSPMRLRFRDGRDKPALMKPGHVYRVSWTLTQLSRYLAPGHRLRLQLTSSDFPAWGRNFNTGGRNLEESSGPVTQVRILHSPEFPSHLILPVMPATEP